MDYLTLQDVIRDLDCVLSLRQVSELRSKYEALAEAIEEDMASDFELEMDDGA